MTLNDQVAVVTGAGRGLGRGIALALQSEGANVVAIARTDSQLKSLSASATRGGGRIKTVTGDVSEPSEVTGLIAAAMGEFGRIDLLVNNAGIADGEVPVWEADVDDWWRVVTTNLRGPMLMMHAAIPAMIAQASGRIVNMNSGRAAFAKPTVTAYAASKSGLARLTATSASALAGSGVSVFDLSPGVVRTSMTDALGEVAGYPADLFTPPELTENMIIAIANGRLDQLTGRFLNARDDIAELESRSAEIVRVNGRVLRIAPGFKDDPVAANSGTKIAS